MRPKTKPKPKTKPAGSTATSTSTSTELVPITPTAAAGLPALVLGVDDVLKAFLAGRNPRTLLAYDKDLQDFARFVGAADARSGVGMLLNLPHGSANAAALAYKASLVDRGLKSATIGRRLAALRSVVKMARTLGVVAWTLDVENPKVEPYRDTAGPGDAGWRAMLACARLAAESGRAKPVRDLAIIRLLHDLGLRRGELVALDLADVELAAGAASVAIVGKGRTDKARLTLPDPTRDALAEWVERRGEEPGPLFVRLDRAAAGPDRLTDTGVYLLVQGLGRKAGLARPTRPHGLRHEAITRALDRTNGDVRTVQRFSRHADPKTLLRYDDCRRDLAGDVARLVAED
jgi:integrase/recombinase XerC